MSVQKKLVIVGDGGCGKTCLLVAFAKDVFLSDYRPTVFENYVADVELDNATVELSLWDTSGQEDYDRLRPIQYPETDVVLICFSVMWRDSLLNVSSRWCPEVRHFCPNVPILLVGTKSDLREDEKELKHLEKMKKLPVTREEAEAMAQTINAVCYIECSAKSKFNVQEVFKEAARATIRKKKKRKNVCLLI